MDKRDSEILLIIDLVIHESLIVVLINDDTGLEFIVLNRRSIP